MVYTAILSSFKFFFVLFSLLFDFERSTWVEESKIFLKVVSSHEIVGVYAYALLVFLSSM